VAVIAADADHAGAEQDAAGVLLVDLAALREHADARRHVVAKVRDAADPVHALAAGAATEQSLAAAAQAEHAGAFARTAEREHAGRVAARVGQQAVAVAVAAFREHAASADVAAIAGHAGAAALARPVRAPAGADDRVERHRRPEFAILLGVLGDLDDEDCGAAEFDADRTRFDRTDVRRVVVVLGPDRRLVVRAIDATADEVVVAFVGSGHDASRNRCRARYDAHSRRSFQQGTSFARVYADTWCRHDDRHREHSCSSTRKSTGG
jgi:hypothetical protein